MGARKGTSRRAKPRSRHGRIPALRNQVAEGAWRRGLAIVQVRTIFCRRQDGPGNAPSRARLAFGAAVSSPVCLAVKYAQ